MNPLLRTVAPSASGMIRMDHTHVVATFHQLEADTAPRTKQALANTVCLALEIHARLEEEIFYPAMREAGSAAVGKSVPEHDEIRRLIAQLKGLEAGTPGFDETFMQLMREVLHHVADEETVLLPEAERVLGTERLVELGAQMTRRRLELTAPHAGEMAMNTVKAMPASTMIMAAGALLAGGYLVTHAMKRHAWAK